MEIFFHDPSDVPLPPNEVHIRKFVAKPYPDGKRIRIYLELSPFQKRPSGEVTIVNSDGNQVALANIIETIDPRMEMTLHIRGPKTNGIFTAKADLFYDSLPPLDEGAQEDESISLPERQMVDHAETTFEIESMGE